MEHPVSDTNFSAGNNATKSNYNSLRFYGSGREYFGIWIVNLFLTIITLGIYSAWATVRTKRYFYRSTELNGSPFEFHGKPLNILLGRIIAVILLLLYSYSSLINPFLPAVIVIALVGLFPYFFVLSWRFKLNNSSWRGVFLGLKVPTKRAYGAVWGYYVAAILLIGIVTYSSYFLVLDAEKAIEKFDASTFLIAFGAIYLAILIVGLCIYAKLYNYVLSNSLFGLQQFAFLATLRPWLTLAGKVILVCILSLIIIGILFFSFLSASTPDDLIKVTAVIYLVSVMLLTLPTIMWQAGKFNLIFSHLESNQLHFLSSLETWELYKLVITNWLIIILTLGLAYPWAAVRVARYKVESVNIKGDLDKLEGQDNENATSIGEEVGNAFDWDIGV